MKKQFIFIEIALFHLFKIITPYSNISSKLKNESKHLSGIRKNVAEQNSSIFRSASFILDVKMHHWSTTDEEIFIHSLSPINDI